MTEFLASAPIPDFEYQRRYELLNIPRRLADLAVGNLPANMEHIETTNHVKVFSFDTGNQQLIVRTPAEPKNLQSPAWHSLWQGRLQGLRIGANLDGFEQLFAYDTTGHSIVTHRAPGQQIEDLPTHLVHGIAKPQLTTIMHALRESYIKNLTLDGDVSNFFYHPICGFTIIDYEYEQIPEIPWSLPKQYGTFIAAMGQTHHGRTPPEHRDAWRSVMKQAYYIGAELCEDGGHALLDALGPWYGTQLFQ